MGVRTFLPPAFLAESRPAIIRLTRSDDYTGMSGSLQSLRLEVIKHVSKWGWAGRSSTRFGSQVIRNQALSDFLYFANVTLGYLNRVV